MGKRNRRRQREGGVRKYPNESKVAFRVRFTAWLNSQTVWEPK